MIVDEQLVRRITTVGIPGTALFAMSDEIFAVADLIAQADNA